MSTLRQVMGFGTGALLLSGAAWGTPLQDSVPVLSSRPGAAYTIYLNPAGFAYTGDWYGFTPGTNLGYEGAGPGDTFTSDDQDAIRAMWAVMANQYASFDVNITTVDPAVAAGQAGSDIERQGYYDSQARMMHVVIGPPGNAGWQGIADGRAGIGVIDQAVAAGSGEHTSWMFSQNVDFGNAVVDGHYIGYIATHEVGHTFGLEHQGDFIGGVQVHEFSNGDDSNGVGNYGPIMGNGYGRQRIAWRVGTVLDDNNNPVQQNDVAVIMGNDGMTFADSGIGHSFATATEMPVFEGSVDVNHAQHRGVINPVDMGSGFNPIGYQNYTGDFFTFEADGTRVVTLTLNNGNDLLVAGVADPGMTFRGYLEIYDEDMLIVATGLESFDTGSVTFSGLLAAGTYFAVVTSYDGHEEVTADYDPAAYYDMGGYFFTGTGLVPEPGTLAFIGIGGLLLLRRRRGTD